MDKVTISGPERFGFMEPDIIRILEELENSESLNKYIFKYRQDENLNTVANYIHED